VVRNPIPHFSSDPGVSSPVWEGWWPRVRAVPGGVIGNGVGCGEREPALLGLLGWGNPLFLTGSCPEAGCVPEELP